MRGLRVGNIHPRFFRMHPKLRKFSLSVLDDGVQLDAPEFGFKYREDGALIGDDIEVLRDISKIIKGSYGTHLSKAQVAERIDWDSVPDNVDVVNVGVVYKESDPTSGWDGSINSIWYDDNAPGTVINTYYRFFITRSLHDFSGWTPEQVRESQDTALAQKLIAAKVACHDEAERDRLDSLIKEAFRAAP